MSDNTRLSQITITSWNCRGLTTSLPYILHLINTGSDIISLSEHWLWPYNITTLSNIHPNYEGFGYCDQKLHESSTLTNGCGGVGFIWKKELNILPLYDIKSDRFCVIQLLQPGGSKISLISVYLPSTNYDHDTYFEELQSVVGSLEKDGPIILCGDLNVDSTNKQHSPSRLELRRNIVDHHSLYVLSQGPEVSGPNYTYFSKSTIGLYHYLNINLW